MSLPAGRADIQEAWRSCRADPPFVRELRQRLADWVGRPTPLTRADRLAEGLGGDLRVYLKREDLAHTGSQEINSCVGQALLAQHMGKRRLVTGTDRGRHGIAAASAAARCRLRCVVYMGQEAIRRQEGKVLQMRLLGAEVVPVAADGAPGVPARLAAEREWTQSLHETYYLPDPSLAEDPHVLIARDLQGIVGHEARSQVFESEGRTPDAVVAWSGDGAGAAGLFQAFADDRAVRTFGIDAAAGAEAAPDAGRLLAATEGILPSFESSCALAFVAREGPRGGIGRTILVGLHGRADADGVPGDDMRARA